MYIPGPFTNFGRFLFTLPARILIGPFLILFICIVGKLTFFEIVTVPSLNKDKLFWFFTLPARAVIAPFIFVFLLLFGNLDYDA